ncbi:outer membrane beta-barrel protein [Jannaschia sp. CCS1]|uniref:outer membrane beta-barrel protein n=1 Tax=Jannaschia sp. (strain CCS1) TaxID=290400 RepID=UPI00140FC8B7|nr:outer membrane beta-barrel protein [Jannaschia sp. CCS1]
MAWATGGMCTFAIGVQAQEIGTLATFDLSFGGQYTVGDGSDADESLLTTDLGFTLQSITRAQSFSLSADGRLQFDEDGGGIENPGLAADYTRANETTALSLGVSYSLDEVDGEMDILDPLTQSVINFIDDDGTLETVTATAGLQTGLDARFGTDTQFSYSSRRYSGTSDPDLTDSDILQASMALRFDVSPAISLEVTANHVRREESGGTNESRETSRAGIGAEILLDPLWTATVDLQYSDISTEVDDGFGGRLISGQTGTGFTLTVNREFRTGTLGVSVSRQIAANGAEDSVRVSRTMELANDGVLSWSLGLVSFSNGDTSPIASFAYAVPTRRGNFAVNLQQMTALNEGDQSVISTVAGLSYNLSTTEISRWSLTGDLTRVDVVGSDTEDQQRLEVGVSYSHALTRDWDLSAGVSHRVNYAGGDQDSSASTLSIALGRSFSLRP